MDLILQILVDKFKPTWEAQHYLETHVKEQTQPHTLTQERVTSTSRQQQAVYVSRKKPEPDHLKGSDVSGFQKCLHNIIVTSVHKTSKLGPIPDTGVSNAFQNLRLTRETARANTCSICLSTMLWCHTTSIDLNIRTTKSNEHEFTILSWWNCNTLDVRMIHIPICMCEP